MLVALWYIITTIQSILAYGTAYRLTKNGGDDGVALFGWFFLMNLASAIPGLGIYLWFKYRDLGNIKYIHDSDSDDYME